MGLALFTYDMKHFYLGFTMVSIASMRVSRAVNVSIWSRCCLGWGRLPATGVCNRGHPD
eukprot:SAG31_NODE_45155_length_260_cov_0.627329_1_plen_58_part_10